jgi:hypothetical protein
MKKPDQEQPVARGKQSRSRAFMLLLFWLLAGAILGAARITSPSFALQGDVPLHYHLTRSFALSLTEGEWLPRWAGLLDGGRGDAVFTFYPPLYYWLSSGLVALLDIDSLNALKCVSFLSLALAGANAHLLTRELTDRKWSAEIGKRFILLAPAIWSTLAGLIFLTLPSYSLLALHRGFLPNALALSLLPLAVLGAHLLLTGKQYRRGLLLFALGFSAIILTHAITAYLCGLAIGLMALCYLSHVGWRGALRLAGGSVVVLALTAFFWGPQLTELNWVQVGLQVVQQDYRHYFLFADAASAGAYHQAWADLNFVASLVILAQTALTLTLGLACYWLLPRSHFTPLVRFSLALALLGLFIALPWSDLLWRHVPGLKFIQFPWRFQPFVALGAALCAATLCSGWASLKRRARITLFVALTWLVIANLLLTFLIARPPRSAQVDTAVTQRLKPSSAPPLTFEQANQLRQDDSLEFLAYTGNQIYFRPRGAELTFYPPVDQVGGLSIISGQGRVVSKQLRTARREFQIENEGPVRARLETYHYPNWVARLDGRIVATQAELESGLMLIDLPSGAHTLTLDFETQHRLSWWARVITIPAWLCFIGWIMGRKVFSRVSQSSAKQS